MKRLLLIPVLLCAVTAKGYAYDAKATYSADQLFDNSLQELREAMAKAKQSNEEFKDQNRSLKDQINELEEAVSAAGSDKIIVEAQADSPWSDEVLAQQEQKLYRARLENVAARLSRVSGQKERLENKVDLYAQENQETQQRIAALKKEVSDIQLALNTPQKTKDAKTDSKSLMLAKQLDAKKEQLKVLEKKLAMQKEALKAPLAQKEKYTSDSVALADQLEVSREKLARLQSAQKMLGQPQGDMDRSASSDSMARRDVNDLQDSRDRLRASLNDLKKATASVKSPSTADLEKILKTYKEQQALLQKKMDGMQPGSSLVARKENLMAEKKRLEGQIALARTGSAAPEASSSDLEKSKQRLSELKIQMAAAKNSSPLQKRYEGLSGQVAVLQQDLQNLREHPQEALKQDPQEVKAEIADLEARRMVLAKSVEEIYAKYNMKELPTEDLASKETQLKEYFETLRLENNALQQKLLTLQMRQDKSLPTVQ
ncbi:MAG: hypothetical protein IT395_00245 [Candidatus Omnitrophica bacterium]|nr:hypothetical protein [Candidatus Omnitrophota bacterium]